MQVHVCSVRLCTYLCVCVIPRVGLYVHHLWVCTDPFLRVFCVRTQTPVCTCVLTRVKGCASVLARAFVLRSRARVHSGLHMCVSTRMGIWRIGARGRVCECTGLARGADVLECVR